MPVVRRKSLAWWDGSEKEGLGCEVGNWLSGTGIEEKSPLQSCDCSMWLMTGLQSPECFQQEGAREDWVSFSTRAGCSLFWQDWSSEMEWKGEWQNRLFGLCPVRGVGKLCAKSIRGRIRIPGEQQRTERKIVVISFNSSSYSLVDFLYHSSEFLLFPFSPIFLFSCSFSLVFR